VVEVGCVTVLTKSYNVKVPSARVLSGCDFILQGLFAKILAISFCLRAARVLSSTLRQGPWIEGWRTPPGPEGSNGSLPFLVVVP